MDAVFSSPLPNRLHVGNRRSKWQIPCALLLASAVALSFDITVASVFENKQLPKALQDQLVDSLSACETFGHGTGAILIIVTVGVLDRMNRRNLLWMAAGALGSGMMANVVKLLVRRTRPYHSGMQEKAISVWDTFDKAANPGMPMQSFPSAHTATAIGLAMMLSALYPRGRWLFFILAILVGAQRIVVSAHFPSDVLAGASIGWIVGTVCAHSMMLSKQRREATIG